jgi:hypothetical protein
VGAGRGIVGALVAAASGIALLAIMFGLTWYDVDGGESIPIRGDVDLTFNAWDAFDIVDYGFLAVAVIGVAAGVVTATRSGDATFVAGGLAAIAGAVGVLVLAYRITDPPTLIVNGFVIEEEGGVTIDAEIGAFLGLVALGGVMIGGWLCLQASGTTARETLKRLNRLRGAD